MQNQTPKIVDTRVRKYSPVLSPISVKERHPLTDRARQTVIDGRRNILTSMYGRSQVNPLIVFVGPCSIHDAGGAIEFAERLAHLAQELSGELTVVMRAYFEKPRSALGWKGLINDPNMDATCDINTGLERARRLLLKINELGLPVATEFLDPFVPQYLGDLVSWAAIGARTTESQTHREMASGLSMPVGFKNGTDGDLQTAINAMLSANYPHRFFGVNEDGVNCLVEAAGNPDCHLVLRGGKSGPNYDEKSISFARQKLHAAGLKSITVVDCSHDNSGKNFEKQKVAFRSVLEQRLAGNDDIVGVMLESYLRQGSQPIPKNHGELIYGVSVTDACIGWEETEGLLREASEQLRGFKKKQ